MLSRTFHKLWHTHAPLTLSALVTALVTLFFIVGIFADPRVITGAPAWLKPAKFGVSITLYSLTLVWILGFIRGRPRLVTILGWVVLSTFALEWFAILTQVVRGTTSHFNIASPFDAALWGVMAASIAVLWGANFVIAGLLLFQKFENPVFAWSLRLGLALTILGMGLGYLMTSPTAQQLAGWQAGGRRGNNRRRAYGRVTRWWPRFARDRVEYARWRPADSTLCRDARPASYPLFGLVGLTA